MSKYYCLISQKETKERNKLKCLIISCEQLPEDYVASLQENHCMEYQLIIYSLTSDDIVNEVEELCKEKKTGYGKNWYELSDSDIAAVISAHFRNGKVVFDFTSISDIVKHSLNLTSIGGDERVHVIPQVDRNNIVHKFHEEALVEHVPVAPTIISKDPVIVVPSKHHVSAPVHDSIEVTSRSDLTKSESVPSKSRNHKNSPEFARIKNVPIVKRDYKRFIDKHCVRADDVRVHTVELNDSFIDYLVDNKKLSIRDFSNPDDRETLFKGFIKLGFKTGKKDKNYYIDGISLKKPNAK